MADPTAAPKNGPSVGRRDVRPPIDAYRPSMWGDTFTAFSLDDQVQETYVETIAAMKKEVKIKLMDATDYKLIVLIDTLERLGLAYHFETEIEEKLEGIYNVHTKYEDEDHYDLFTTALQFRLLRQHRYHVSSGVLDKFLDKNNKFKESLSCDVEGLLSLYEAANVEIHGEDILKEAALFTTHHLSRIVQQLPPSFLHDKVKLALETPFYKSVQIVQARNFISIYERDDSRDELLLNFAKFNFNFLQNLYKKDLCQLSQWWNKFDFKTTLPYVKDRLIESYIWGVAFHFEPQYSYVRKAVAISIQIITVTDDTYDNYATLEEAQLFTDALERWTTDEMDLLPDYMKLVYRFLMSICADYEREAAKEEKSFAVPYFKEAVMQLCRAYNKEQIWVRERQIPSVEEYNANALITSCVYIILMTLIPGIKSVSKETIDWLLSEPKAVTTTAKMGRSLDDLSTHQRENKGGEILTAAECFMKHYGISKEETLAMWIKQSEDGWKDLNTEWIANTSPKDMVELLRNYARVCQLTYRRGDGYTNPEKILAPTIAKLFVDPILIV